MFTYHCSHLPTNRTPWPDYCQYHHNQGLLDLISDLSSRRIAFLVVFDRYHDPWHDSPHPSSYE